MNSYGMFPTMSKYSSSSASGNYWSGLNLSTSAGSGAVAGSIAGPVGSVIGGLIGAAGSLIGTSMSNKASAKAQEESNRLQKEYAQNQIQWRVEDAKKAGIHPLYALGAQGISYQPLQSADVNGIAEAAQSVNRGLSSAGMQMQQMAIAQQELATQRQAIENELLQKQLQQADYVTMQEALNTKSMFDIEKIKTTAGAPYSRAQTNEYYNSHFYDPYSGAVLGYTQRPESEMNWVEKAIDGVRGSYYANDKVKDLNKLNKNKYMLGVVLSGRTGLELVPIEKSKANIADKFVNAMIDVSRDSYNFIKKAPGKIKKFLRSSGPRPVKGLDY